MGADAGLSLDRPPYLTQTITQALALPDPPHPEPRQHESVNALLDFRAQHSPDKTAAGFISSDSGTTKWKCTTLTYAQVKRLSVGLSSRLQPLLPDPVKNVKSPNETPIIAVLSPSGIHLFAHILALWRLGYGVLCIAPGAPPESIANLLRTTTTATVLCHSSQLESALSGVRAAADGHNGIEAKTVSMLDEITPLFESAESSTDELSNLSSKSSANDVLVVMHTSGSSGLPKPIYQLHRFWTNSMASAPGVDLSAFTTTPLFHGGMSDLLRSVQAGSAIFFHPTADPGALSPSAICSAMQACPAPNVSYFLSVPYILELLFNDRSGAGIQMLKSLQLVSTGGAPLPERLGDDMVRQGIRLVSRLGSSECGFLMSSWRDFAADMAWSHLRVRDKLGQQLLQFESTLRPSASENTTEPPEANTETFELVVGADWPTKLVSNREDGSYATSDLYAPHPTMAHTWRYDSRSDDVLVLINGKKVPALLAESKLKQLPDVSEAVVFGANRAILGALVFVTPESIHTKGDQTWNRRTKVSLLRSLQPTLTIINESSAPHAQLAIEMIHLMTPQDAEQIPRASKGSLQRGRAYTQYASLIDQVYTDFEEGRSLHVASDDSSQEDCVATKQLLSGSDLIDWLVSTVRKLNKETKVDAETDFFAAGVDSIQAARMRAAIHQNIDLGESGRLVAQNVVYDYPTPMLLAEHLQQVRDSRIKSDNMDRRQEEDLVLMQDLVDKYSKGFAPSKAAQKGMHHQVDSSVSEERSGVMYLLTGATGGLGAQLASELLLKAATSRDCVVFLARAKSDAQALDRVLQALSSRCLTQAHEVLSSMTSHSRTEGEGKVSKQAVCFAADLPETDCGLSSRVLDYLMSAASASHRLVTIHAAWAVNFVIGLSSFEHSQIKGLQNLIMLHEQLVSATGSAKDHMEAESCFGFCSSTAAILGQSSNGPHGENLPQDPRAAVAMGYARSKWVAEHIVSRASAARSTLPNGLDRGSKYAILRIGQLCSDTRHGVWNEREAWPILISLSCKLGKLPRLGPGEKLDWLAVDVAARTVLDLLQCSSSGNRGEKETTGTAKVYNVALPSSGPTHHETANWDDLFNWLTSSGLDLQYVAPLEWTRLVREKSLDDRGLLTLWEQNFTSSSTVNHDTAHKSEPVFDTSATIAASPANFVPWKEQGVDLSLVNKTVQRWKGISFL